MSNPDPSGAGFEPGCPDDEGQGMEEQHSEEERVSYAAYFGAATGLVAGLVVAMLGAAWLYGARPESDWAMMFWEITSPLFAILGFVSAGYVFHRRFRGQVALPAVIFLGALVLGAYLAAGPVGFPWQGVPGA